MKKNSIRERAKRNSPEVKSHVKKAMEKDKELSSIDTRDIVNMVSSIISICIQKGVCSIPKDEARQFYHSNNFEQCFKKVLPCLVTHGFKNLEDYDTYSVPLKRKLFDGTIVNGHDIQTAISKSDR